MKKLLVLFSALLAFCSTANAAQKQISYLEEMYLLGTISGQGLACKSKQYHKFELLARALIVSKATSDEEQRQGMERYTTGKINAFADMEVENFRECGRVTPAFENQKIFNSVLYSDGRIKMYDGKMITPRKPYDASTLYQKDPEAFVKADAAYKKYLELAKKNRQNAPKIELHDSRATQFSNMFN